jgi:hypothetical protein
MDITQERSPPYALPSGPFSNMTLVFSERLRPAKGLIGWKRVGYVGEGNPIEIWFKFERNDKTRRDDDWCAMGTSHNFDSRLKDSKGRSLFDLTISHLLKGFRWLSFADFVAPTNKKRRKQHSTFESGSENLGSYRF